MLVATLVVLAGFSGSAFAQNPFLTVCNAVQQQTCQGQFNDALGIDASYSIQQFEELRISIERSYATGKAEGLLTTCMAFKNFKNCFTDENYFACAENPLGLLANGSVGTGVTKAQAFGYTKIWNQLDFVCGAGFALFANAEDCASGIFSNQTQALRECDTDLLDSIASDPLDVCSYIEIAANCYRMIFWNACRRPEISFFGCNYERVGTELNYPQCNSFCSFHELI